MVNLKGIPGYELQQKTPADGQQGIDTEGAENVAQTVNQQTPVTGLWRSSRISKPV